MSLHRGETGKWIRGGFRWSKDHLRNDRNQKGERQLSEKQPVHFCSLLSAQNNLSGWRRVGPWRSGRAYSRVCGAATAKGSEHVRVMRRQAPLFVKPLTLTLSLKGRGQFSSPGAPNIIHALARWGQLWCGPAWDHQ